VQLDKQQGESLQRDVLRFIGQESQAMPALGVVLANSGLLASIVDAALSQPQAEATAFGGDSSSASASSSEGSGSTRSSSADSGSGGGSGKVSCLALSCRLLRTTHITTAMGCCHPSVAKPWQLFFPLAGSGV